MDVHTYPTDTGVHHTTTGFCPRKHCHTVEAGLLACNIFAVLPTSLEGKQWTFMGKNG